MNHDAIVIFSAILGLTVLMYLLRKREAVRRSNASKNIGWDDLKHNLLMEYGRLPRPLPPGLTENQVRMLYFIAWAGPISIENLMEIWGPDAGGKNNGKFEADLRTLIDGNYARGSVLSAIMPVRIQPRGHEYLREAAESRN